MKTSAGLLVMAFLLGSSVAAQQPRHDSGPPRHMMPGMHGMMMSMGPEMVGAMRVFVFAPEHLLARKDSLGLSAQQVTRLTALRDTAQARRTAALAEAKPHLQAIEQGASGTTVDTAALKTHFEAAHAAMGRAHWAMLSAAAQARAVLTDAQRAKAKAWADSMGTWMGRHPGWMHSPD
jgi:hypothetical protein